MDGKMLFVCGNTDKSRFFAKQDLCNFYLAIFCGIVKGIAPYVPLGTIIRGNVPFALIMLLGVVVITIFPEIVTWLPNMMVR